MGLALFNDSGFPHLLYFDLYFIIETVGRSVGGSLKSLFGFRSELFNQVGRWTVRSKHLRGIRKKVLSLVDLLSIARHHMSTRKWENRLRWSQIGLLPIHRRDQNRPKPISCQPFLRRKIFSNFLFYLQS